MSSAAARSAWTEHTLGALRRAGLRSGGARTAVVELLGAQDCCLTAQEIFDELRVNGRAVGIASVYRVLDLLAGMELVQRLDVGGGAAHYEACHPGGEHHHHLVCVDCGRVVAFEDHGLEDAIDQLADRLGCAVDGHDVVLRGACTDCERSASEPRVRRPNARGRVQTAA